MNSRAVVSDTENGISSFIPNSCKTKYISRPSRGGSSHEWSFSFKQCVSRYAAATYLLAAVAVAPTTTATTTVKQECRVKRIPAISLEQQQLDSILGYFVYTLMSTRSSLGVNIPKCTWDIGHCCHLGFASSVTLHLHYWDTAGECVCEENPAVIYT